MCFLSKNQAGPVGKNLGHIVLLPKINSSEIEPIDHAKKLNLPATLCKLEMLGCENLCASSCSTSLTIQPIIAPPS